MSVLIDNNKINMFDKVYSGIDRAEAGRKEWFKGSKVADVVVWLVDMGARAFVYLLLIAFYTMFVLWLLLKIDGIVS